MYRNLRPVFNSEEEIRCVFYNVIVKMQSLRLKYPGGIKAFMERHTAYCNRHLAVVCSMGSADLDGLVEELLKAGFVDREDFVCCTDDSMWIPLMERLRPDFGAPSGSAVDLPVDWLEARMQSNGTVFRFVEQSIGRKPQSRRNETK